MMDKYLPFLNPNAGQIGFFNFAISPDEFSSLNKAVSSF
jgi:hypothetical protein